MYVRLVYENVLSSISKWGHNFLNNLLGLTVKQIQYCALIRNTHSRQKIRIVPYWCPLFLIGAHCSLLVPTKFFEKNAKKA